MGVMGYCDLYSDRISISEDMYVSDNTNNVNVSQNAATTAVKDYLIA